MQKDRQLSERADRVLKKGFGENQAVWYVS